MKLSQFKFKLPDEKIALYPTDYRDESRLMVVHKDILNYFDDKDVFIFNDTKVFPARLYGNKEKTGAKIEVFLLRELNEELRLWDVLVDPARKIRIGNMHLANHHCHHSSTAAQRLLTRNVSRTFLQRTKVRLLCLLQDCTSVASL